MNRHLVLSTGSSMSEPPAGWRWTRIEFGVAALVLSLLAALLLPAVQQAREAARRSQSKNNLKQLGIGFHNYHETFNCFPPGGTFAADGTPNHSWTLFIHPYLVASPLYNRIDTDRPWDDPVNRQRLHRNDPCFQDPGISQASENSAGFSAVHYSPNQRLLFRNSSTQLSDIPDQTQTLLAGDAFGNFAAFGDPINWRDATLPFRTSTKGFGHVTPARADGTHVLFADGSVEFLANTISPERHRQLAGTGIPEPSSDLTEQRTIPYQVPATPPRSFLNLGRSHLRSGASFSLIPDRTHLLADFGSSPGPINPKATRAWWSEFSGFVEDAPIVTAEIHGDVEASELSPFLDIASLRTLDLYEARVHGDATAILSRKPGLTVRRPTKD